jgi:hypothetical protein
MDETLPRRARIAIGGLKMPFLALAASLIAAPPVATPEPVRAAYYYKVRWGFQKEFETLFFKNHYPLLMAQKPARIRSVEVFHPTFHGDGRADWTFLVVITFADWAAFQGVPGEEEALAKRLFPDQETFRKEELRRFEILDAHWDVPLTPVQPPQ